MEELKHFSHFHPLIPGGVREVNLYVVWYGCKKPISGVLYWCNKCDFYLHKRCAELPQEINDPIHPQHLLTMNLPLGLCGSRGSESENEDDEHLHSNLLHFPLTDDFVVVPKHPVELINHEKIKRRKKIKHKSHKDHELILYDGHGQNNTEMIKHDTISSCHMCVQPISLPFYICVRCNHFIHFSCANLPAELARPNHSNFQSQNVFFLSGQKERHSLFRCTSCDLDGNGFSYKLRDMVYSRNLHLKWAFLPNVILHETHRHPLVQIRRLGVQCRACHVMCNEIGYKCEKCNFGICFHCALLPHTLRHKWDAHPLILSYPPIKDHPDEY